MGEAGGILYFEDWTGLDWTGLVKCGLVKRGFRIGSCGRLFFLWIFSAFVNRIKLNGEQTLQKLIYV